MNLLHALLIDFDFRLFCSLTVSIWLNPFSWLKEILSLFQIPGVCGYLIDYKEVTSSVGKWPRLNNQSLEIIGLTKLMDRENSCVQVKENNINYVGNFY